MSSIAPAAAYTKAVSNWLLACILIVILMVAIGGVTRLTESGLSIVKWKLVSGTLPPLTAEAWQHEFDDYKHTPQYKKVNRDFSVDDFKHIFWLEYLHRLIGRTIGLVIFLPFVYFAARRALPKRLLWRGAFVTILVGAQGTVGWIMVASGLNDEPRVEPLKLMLHLLLAFALFAALLWTRWQVNATPRFPVPCRTAIAARILLFLATLQIAFGALVAGLRAGLIYNTYPLMDGQFIPDSLYRLSPWWLNHVESVMTVQFQHRMLALLVAAGVVGFVALAWNSLPERSVLKALVIAIIVQFALGVATLLSVVAIPLASLHQLGALLLFGLLLRLVYRCGASFAT